MAEKLGQMREEELRLREKFLQEYKHLLPANFCAGLDERPPYPDIRFKPFDTTLPELSIADIDPEMAALVSDSATSDIKSEADTDEDEKSSDLRGSLIMAAPSSPSLVSGINPTQQSDANRLRRLENENAALRVLLSLKESPHPEALARIESLLLEKAPSATTSTTSSTASTRVHELERDLDSITNQQQATLNRVQELERDLDSVTSQQQATLERLKQFESLYQQTQTELQNKTTAFAEALSQKEEIARQLRESEASNRHHERVVHEIQQALAAQQQRINELQVGAMISGGCTSGQNLQELAQLHQQVQQFQAKEQQLLQSQHQLQHQLHQLQTALTDSQTRERQLSSEKADLSQQVHILKQQSCEVGLRVTHLMFENKALRQQVESRSQLSQFPHQLTELQQQLALADQKLSQSQLEREQLLAEISRLMDDKQSLMEAKQSLLEEQSRVMDQKSSLMDEKQALMEEKKSLMEENKSLTYEKQSLMEEKLTLMEEKRSLMDEKSRYLDEKSSLEKLHADQIQQFQQLLRTSNQRVNALTLERDQLAKKYEQLSQEYAQLSQQHQQLSGPHPQSQQQFDQLSQQHQQLQQQYDQLSQQHQQITNEREQHQQLTKQHAQLTNEREQLVKQLQQSLKQHEQVTNEREQLVQQYARLSQQHEQLKQESMVLLQEREKAMRDEHTRSIAVMSQEHEVTQARLRGMESQNEQLLQRMDEMEIKWNMALSRKLSLEGFQENDLALFTSDSVGNYYAINRDCPNYFLSEESKNSVSRNPRIPRFIVGKIIIIEPNRVANNMINPYSLEVGTDYYVVTCTDLFALDPPK
eukprot:TRINITY_DN4525_c0_g1_i1.p1 TRINITY_DN4525_c0_g1~~TRINITY_DN4525_c0_g1_i1.p1  ORF type:complete len:820 (+),score=236.05 TRINITY_DN4525_c0_g1_i1:255-2714(+)